MQNLLFPRQLPFRRSPLLPALLLFSSFILIPAFALVSDFSPIPSRFFRLYSCFRPLPLYRIRSCFRFSPNPVPLLPALLLLLSFIIPAFALVSDFPPILPRFFRFYSCFCPLPLYPHSLLFPIFPQSRPASFGFTPVFVLYPYTAFALVSDFPPIPSRFFRLYSCFCPSLYPHSLLFPIFPQSCPAFSGFTPVFALYPYTRIRSCFRFFLNPAPLFPVLLLFSSFIIPAFALIDIFTPYSFFLCFERLHKQADADMPARP